MSVDRQIQINTSLNSEQPIDTWFDDLTHQLNLIKRSKLEKITMELQSAACKLPAITRTFIV